MRYDEPQKVRLVNSEQFVKDFKRYIPHAYCTVTKTFFAIRKMDLWKQAKTRKISYYLSDKLYTVKRTSLVVI